MRTGTFAPDDVAAVLAAADRDRTPIELVKDEGVYLLTGNHPNAVVVYATGLDSPAGHESGTDPESVFDPGWLAQRVRITDAMGGDDLAVVIDPAELRGVAAPGPGVAFDTTVNVLTWPDGKVPGGGGLEGLTHLTQPHDISAPRPATPDDSSATPWSPATSRTATPVACPH